jgi:hypothetical protein
MSIGLMGACFLPMGTLFYLLFSSSSISFALPTWSPTGERLAFAVIRDNHPEAIYVVDADGKHQTEVLHTFCGTLVDCSRGIAGLRWSDDGQRVYFSTDIEYHKNYAISVENHHVWRIEASELPALPNPSLVTYETLCDDPGVIGGRPMNSTKQLVAQQVDLSVRSHIANYEMQICDLQSGKPVFQFTSLDYYLPQLNSKWVWYGRLAVCGGFGFIFMGMALRIWLWLTPNRSHSARPAIRKVHPESRR